MVVDEVGDRVKGHVLGADLAGGVDEEKVLGRALGWKSGQGEARRGEP